jgi:hypothetical protein
MINKVLASKHWQLFLLSFFLPMAFHFFMMARMITSVIGATKQKPQMLDPTVLFQDMLYTFPILIILSFGTLFAWYWSVVVGLYSKASEFMKVNIIFFKVCFFFPICYAFCFFGVINYFITTFTGQAVSSEPSFNPIYFLILFPLHMFSMFCLFYIIFQVSKIFRAVELEKEVSFNDFAGEFFLIMFFPLGVWIIQPRINKLIQN